MYKNTFYSKEEVTHSVFVDMCAWHFTIRSDLWLFQRFLVGGMIRVVLKLQNFKMIIFS